MTNSKSYETCECSIIGPCANEEYRIEYCPLHAAAPKMLKALYEIAETSNDGCWECDAGAGFQNIASKAIIAAEKGEKK